MARFGESSNGSRLRSAGKQPSIARMMHSAIMEFLADRLAAGGFTIGQVRVGADCRLRHVADDGVEVAEVFCEPEAALELAKYDDAGAYRPLKTAPNLRRGWELRLADAAAVRMALDFLYPAALGTVVAYLRGDLEVVSLRATLGRQTGMYRITQLMNNEQAAELNRTACNSETGCLRRVLWRIDETLPAPLTEDEVAVEEGEVPLLCAEACNLLVAAARPLGKSNLPQAKG